MANVSLVARRGGGISEPSVDLQWDAVLVVEGNVAILALFGKEEAQFLPDLIACDAESGRRGQCRSDAVNADIPRSTSLPGTSGDKRSHILCRSSQLLVVRVARVIGTERVFSFGGLRVQDNRK